MKTQRISKRWRVVQKILEKDLKTIEKTSKELEKLKHDIQRSIAILEHLGREIEDGPLPH
jgi:hypothetical protein